MTSTPLSTESSWVDVSSDTKSICSIHSHQSPISPLDTNHAKVKSMEKLLMEAQRDGDNASHSISPISPNSPLVDIGSISAIESMLLNREDFLERGRQISNDWLWDWADGKSSNQSELKNFLEQSTQQKKLSLRQWVTRRRFFSKEVLSVFLLSNILSLILGAGIGYSVLLRRSL